MGGLEFRQGRVRSAIRAAGVIGWAPFAGADVFGLANNDPTFVCVA